MKKNKVQLLQAIGVGALVYLAMMPIMPYPGSFLLKAFPIWCMAILAWKEIADPRGKIVALGLALSSVGDVVLTLRSELGFMVGLGFFLIAHITYSIAFSRKTQFVQRRLPFFIAVVAFGAVMGYILAPNLGGMTIPVLAYLLVIAIMVVFSGLCAEVKPILMIGGLAFMASDGMLAINMFLAPFEGAGYGIMITYYLAQFLIVWSFLPREAAAGDANPFSKGIQ